ncbi:Glutamate synthase [Kyrpidia spormannii]|uniref:Glutamate synthase n=1 Tax=Kyrpidia spormannii TaxID=2055160 RepID=A0ACA8ZCJ1_9BACL|nr:Glutamate synthase [Kyrpidia spormannii]
MERILQGVDRMQNELGMWEGSEHDACGIVAAVQRNGVPSNENVQSVIKALIQMQHRAGFVDGEGDGCGILMDLPRKLWSKKLVHHGHPGSLAEDPRFAVGHFFIPRESEESREKWKAKVRGLFGEHRLEILIEEEGNVNSRALGPRGRADEPVFWQVAGLVEDAQGAGRVLFELQLAVEAQTPVHVVSLSTETVVYKVRGSAGTLPDYYPDLASRDLRSAVSIGHNRYSTNTSTVFERVQPFSLLGHNGEINTIAKLREEAEMLGIPLVREASDSQDLNRTLEGLIHRFGLTLYEAMELVFPPIINEIKNFSPDLQDLYMFFRSAWGPFAQGPAGIVSRYGDECVFSVDALGLRPLWMLQTESALFFSSEQGIVELADMVADPKPLAPGEKIGVQLLRGKGLKIHPYHEYQKVVLERAKKRFAFDHFRGSLQFGMPGVALDAGVSEGLRNVPDRPELRDRLVAAFGWDADDLKLLEFEAHTGAEPIRSLGYDGPLAALSRERQNLADFYKETVAVVTNPAIDREREIEHFSTRTVLGPRPSLAGGAARAGRRVELQTPLLLGGHRTRSVLPAEEYRGLAHQLGTYLFEDLLREFDVSPEAVYVLDATFAEDETLKEAVARLGREAADAVEAGGCLLVIDDDRAFRDGRQWIDPHLAVSAVHVALKNRAPKAGADNLRRRVSVVLRSGALRNLHDLVTAIGLGADALNPYLMWELAGGDPAVSVGNLYAALQKGLEKVISTLGIHELRGYDRLFSSIGLKPELYPVLETPGFCGSETAGFGWREFEAEARRRYEIANGEGAARPVRQYNYYPRIWKAAGDAAQGVRPYREYVEKLAEMERSHPISLRHVMDLKESEASGVDPDEVDLSVGEHSLPFLISSMSFGSQNETAYRAYAEAAKQLDMVAMNGEGGEIKDMIGKYPKHRGLQVASGRFGVNIELCNAANILEIKIGQGAKPGEGGHLPGSKVSAKVAAARNAQPGIDLISPSNNHDIYSIEDLAQMIDELKTANPNARVSVKVPVVPNIGTIAVGIAKAGADIITLSGYDGGTGAARAHALKHVGLPVEIGVRHAHVALTEAGLRDQVEIWADGGLKSGLDVVKMILLGANRCGFATLAMVAVGCTSCRACHKDTCHVGIATQIESTEEAKEKGLKMFVPREFDTAVANLVTLFRAMGREVQEWTARLGARRTQDLVGRTDLLEQVRELDRVDVTALLVPTIVSTRKVALASAPKVRLSSVGVDSLTERIAARATLEVAAGSETVVQQVDQVTAHDRVLGSFLAGSVTRGRFRGEMKRFKKANLDFNGGSIAGNGLGAYNAPGVHIRVEGGAQDGVGKTAVGGKIVVMKGLNRRGERLDGSVGKGLAYGAQKGLFIVQGDADSRAGIRLSGADVIIGGMLREPVNDSLGLIGARANLKGFAFEYMTNGRALVLGDPGPWICSGMTGGVVYLRVQPEMGLTEEALKRRIAKGAKVSMQPLDPEGKRDVEELLHLYLRELVRTKQYEEADTVRRLLDHSENHFVMIKPSRQQTDQDIATE